MGAFHRVVHKGRGRANSSRSRSAATPTDASLGRIVPFFNFLPGHPEYRPEEDRRISELRLPEASSYTLAFLGPVLYPMSGSSRLDTLGRLWTQAQRCYLLYALSLSLQVFILMRLYPYAADTLRGSELEACDGSSYLLKLTCTSIFTIAILFDVHETWLMLDWLRAGLLTRAQHAAAATNAYQPPACAL